ncbi:SurA N-terminal domain-containing protein [Oceanobacillus sp. Castelsardo]|uniref:SurA N-terminal domain-containing protein n=1 Tax=Oceanobacillus sp. Castelsardo TaxID=1851204 RepID=UPI00083978A3|nr:SurA N-terminal domain-containing protein [Oceanobacillus sp. Castelsardo]
MVKKGIILCLSCLLLFLTACGDDDKANEKENQGTTQESLEILDEEIVDAETLVVNVNGQELDGKKYNQVYKQIKTIMYQSGQDVSNPDVIKERTLTALIEQELINQEVLNKGIKVKEEDASKELETIKEETGDQFSAILEQLNMNEEDFEKQLLEDLTTEKYMEHEFAVTDKEVEEYYNQLKEENKEIPELEEMKENIKLFLLKNQLKSRLAELKEKAEIEQLI